MYPIKTVVVLLAFPPPCLVVLPTSAINDILNSEQLQRKDIRYV